MPSGPSPPAPSQCQRLGGCRCRLAHAPRGARARARQLALHQLLWRRRVEGRHSSDQDREMRPQAVYCWQRLAPTKLSQVSLPLVPPAAHHPRPPETCSPPGTAPPGQHRAAALPPPSAGRRLPRRRGQSARAPHRGSRRRSPASAAPAGRVDRGRGAEGRGEWGEQAGAWAQLRSHARTTAAAMAAAVPPHSARLLFRSAAPHLRRVGTRRRRPQQARCLAQQLQAVGVSRTQLQQHAQRL